MRVARKFAFVVISLSLASVFTILCYMISPVIQHNFLWVVSPTTLLIHLLFNTIIITIVTKEHNIIASYELECSFICCFAYEMEEHDGKTSLDDADEDHVDDLEGGDYRGKYYEYEHQYYDSDYEGDDDHYDQGSDGYDEDDDDDGSYGEIGWDDDDEEVYDSEFERRIEAFIAKVIKGWKEEHFSDNMQWDPS